MNLLRYGVVLAALLFAAPVFPSTGAAAVSLDIHIGPPPVYRFAAPPRVVVIPGTYVYTVPDVDVDILFFSGYWYRPYEGHWFRARSYNGPWAYCPDPRVPRALLSLPPDYHHVPPGYRRIPHRDFKRNWGRWERERHWDNDRDWRQGWHGGPGERHEERSGRPEGEHGRDFDRGGHGHGPR